MESQTTLLDVDPSGLQEAAKAILEADFLLIGAGAGFSADSGLSVYKDIAKFDAYEKMGVDYAELSQPHWIEKDPEIFYGFWGKCYNDYMDTSPHEGYSILKHWRQTLFAEKEFNYQKNGDDIRRNLRRMQIYTSNVDRMFNKSGFDAAEIEEIHGNSLTMQCSKPCSQRVWSLPNDFRFKIDMETMRCQSDHPKCKCGRLARPNVMMFCDPAYFRADSADPDYNYWNFQSNVEQVLRTRPNTKLVILELGAGKRVPSVRVYCQRFLNDSSLPSGSITLIRVNPDFPELDPLQIHNDGDDFKTRFRFISIKSRALPVLQQLDRLVTQFQGGVVAEADAETSGATI